MGVDEITSGGMMLDAVKVGESGMRVSDGMRIVPLIDAARKAVEFSDSLFDLLIVRCRVFSA